MKSAIARVACVACAVFAQAALAASGDPFPSKPVRVVVGPGTDFLPRLLAPKLYSVWGQQLVVDQRPGGGGAIAADIVAKAAPDGHTWLISTAVFTINASMYAKPPYNLERDFAPVAGLASATFLLLVNPAVPAKSVGELIQLAREKPGQLNYASSGVGTPPHLAGEMFKNLARVNMLHVPYKSAAASITELLTGQVQVSFQFMPSVLPHVKAGRLRALGVSSVKRSPLAPELPTIIEAGLPGFEVIGWNGVHVPRGTPRTAIARINAELLKALALPDVRERVSAAGLEPFGGSPEEFGAFVKKDLARWAKVIKDAAIQPE
jgi:tripartite-type tricarboxylate transporter receptor subunit TctC